MKKEEMEQKIQENDEKVRKEFAKAVAGLLNLKDVNAFILLASSREVDENGRQKGLLYASGARNDIMTLCLNIDEQIVDCETVLAFKKLYGKKADAENKE